MGRKKNIRICLCIVLGAALILAFLIRGRAVTVFYQAEDVSEYESVQDLQEMAYIENEKDTVLQFYMDDAPVYSMSLLFRIQPELINNDADPTMAEEENSQETAEEENTETAEENSTEAAGGARTEGESEGAENLAGQNPEPDTELGIYHREALPPERLEGMITASIYQDDKLLGQSEISVEEAYFLTQTTTLKTLNLAEFVFNAPPGHNGYYTLILRGTGTDPDTTIALLGSETAPPYITELHQADYRRGILFEIRIYSETRPLLWYVILVISVCVMVCLASDWMGKPSAEITVKTKTKKRKGRRG